MKPIATALIVTLSLGTVALAHEGVKDPIVAARMDAMSDTGAASKVLGDMARGRADFDADAAAEAKASLIAIAAELPALFEVNATDPKSEAKPEIWENFDDFTAKAAALGAAAEALDTTSLETLSAGMRAVGGSCGGCHKPYRL